MERRCHHKASSHYLLVGGKVFVFNGFIYSIIHGVSLFSTETLQNPSICICSEKLITAVDSNKNGITALTFYTCEIMFCVVSTKFSSRIESVPSCQEIHFSFISFTLMLCEYFPLLFSLRPPCDCVISFYIFLLGLFCFAYGHHICIDCGKGRGQYLQNWKHNLQHFCLSETMLNFLRRLPGTFI